MIKITGDEKSKAVTTGRALKTINKIKCNINAINGLQPQSHRKLRFGNLFSVSKNKVRNDKEIAPIVIKL